MSEEKVYCKKCGAWVVPVNGECPRCGYVFEKGRKKKAILALLVIGAVILIKLIT